MSRTIEYRCPNCGGAVTFDTSQQQMVCPFCKTVISMESLQGEQQPVSQGQPLQTQQLEPSVNPVWQSSNTGWDPGQTNLRVYNCNTCGGEIVGDATLGASSCPFCGNPVIMSGVFSGGLKPDVIIPFKLDKNAAMEALNNLYKGKKLLPKVFRNQNHIDEVKGIYVPFWLYSAQVEAEANYSATRVRSWSDSDTNYTETSYYDVYRKGNMTFSNVPVDGASKIQNSLLESIEPFDYRQLTAFQMPYLSGFYANRYDVDSKTSAPIANSRIINTVINALQATVVGFSSVRQLGSRTAFRNARLLYAMLPVYLLTTVWNNKHFTFAMNGQSGKIAGDNLPVDYSIFWTMFLLIMGGVGIGLFTILTLLAPVLFR